MVRGVSVDTDAGWTPLIMSTIAGMSTCVGALIVFCHPVEEEEGKEGEEGEADPSGKQRRRWAGRRKVGASTMAFSLALAGSVMATVSVVSIAPECLAGEDGLLPVLSWAFCQRAVSFALGVLLYLLLSRCAFPEPEAILAAHSDALSPARSLLSSLRAVVSGADLPTAEARRANRVAMLLFLSLLLHNFPEGLAVAASALESHHLGLTVTVGIMIHNIPEGIAIAIPCLKARPDSPCFSFLLASVSGLAEPAGAFVSLLALRTFQHHQTLSRNFSLQNVLAFVAGIMITVSFAELFPEAKLHAEKGSAIRAYYAGLIIGFILMLVTELGMSL